MPWVKICDDFADHPKIQGLTDLQLRFHIEAMCNAARFKTDGKIARKIVENARKCNALDGLESVWDETEDGYVIHDWLDYNISKKADGKRKKKTLKRVRRHRKGKRSGNAAGNGVTGDDCNPVTSGSGSGSISGTSEEIGARQKSAAVEAVIAHYKAFHPRARPGAKERKLIRDRLDDGYSVADLQVAIDGCHRSPHHCGLNDQGTKYQKLSLIVRDSSQVQQFMEMPEKPRLLGKGDEKRIRTEMAGQRWLNQGNEENDEGNRQAPLLP